jgi:copper transport protein
VLALLGALLLLIVPLRAASAHASLISSVPAAGSHVSTPVNSLHLVFSEPIVAALSHVTLHGSTGTMTDVVISADPRDVHALRGTMPRLADGTYRVTWHITSADGHPVSGTFDFTVGSVATDTLPPVTGPPVGNGMSEAMRGSMGGGIYEATFAGAAVLPALLRGLALSALLSLCGLLGFTAYSSLPESGAQRKLCVSLSIASFALLLAHLVVWLLHISPAHTLDPDTVTAALSREVGLNELVRLILALLAAWAIILARRLRLGFAFALAAVIAGGAIGHPAAINPVISIPFKAIHLVAVAFWIGGLLWILSSDKTSFDTVAAAATVSSIALLAVIATAVSGMVEAFLFLPTLSDLFTSDYGLTLLGKTAGLLILVLFGAYHRYRVLPVMAVSGDARFRGSIRRELVVMIAVIMLGGLLAYVPTPSAPMATGASPTHNAN